MYFSVVWIARAATGNISNILILVILYRIHLRHEWESCHYYFNVFSFVTYARIRLNKQSNVLWLMHSLFNSYLILYLLLKLRFSSLRHGWYQPFFAILFRLFVFLAPTTFKLSGFPIFWLWAYLTNVGYLCID